MSVGATEAAARRRITWNEDEETRNTVRVIFITRLVPNSGAPHAFLPAIWLRKQGYRVTGICPGNPGAARNGMMGAYEMEMDYVRASNALCLDAKMLLRIVCSRIRVKQGVYYVYGSRVCPLAWLGLLGMRRRRVIYHTQDFLEPRRHRLYEFFERRVARRAGEVIVNEENRARLMRSYYGLAEPPVVVKTYLPASWEVPAYDVERRKELCGLFQEPPDSTARMIMCQGAYSSVRCSESVIRAVAMLGRGYYLVFSGMTAGSPQEALARESVSRSGIAGRSAFLGYLSFDKLLEYTAVCDMGLLLYANDGIGNFHQCPGRLTEYLRCGIPVVMSRFPNFEWLATRYGIGVTCESEEPRSIAEAIARLGARPPEQVRADCTRLKQLALTEFAYEKEFPRLEAVVERAMTQEGA